MPVNLINSVMRIKEVITESKKKSTDEMLGYLMKHHSPDLHSDYTDHIKSYSYFVLQKLPISSIKTDLEGLDADKVEQYKKMDFSKAPPIVVGDGYILDGYHRANVARELNIPTIQAWVGAK